MPFYEEVKAFFKTMILNNFECFQIKKKLTQKFTTRQKKEVLINKFIQM